MSGERPLVPEAAVSGAHPALVAPALVRLGAAVRFRMPWRAVHPTDDTRRPCESEGDLGCVWDARHMGNGEGHSYRVSRSGRVTRISHRRAHRLIAEWWRRLG